MRNSSSKLIRSAGAASPPPAGEAATPERPAPGCPVAHGRLPSRRAVLTGALVTGGTAVRAAACASPTLSTGTRLGAQKVAKLPETGDDAAWNMIKGVAVAMDVQVMVKPVRPTPFVKTVDLKAVHDGSRIAFQLVWRDDAKDDLTISVDGFRDAVALLLAPATSDPAMRFMGTASSPATILHWKADWQRDVDHGFQDMEVAFPRSAPDYHPPLAPGIEPLGRVAVPGDYEASNATQWLPGYRVGNPISRPGKQSPVEKLTATGWGTLATMPTQDADGHGVHRDGKWKVMIVRSLAASDAGEVSLEPGKEYSCAVAVWSGRDGDAGGHKTPSKELLTLTIE